MTSETPQANAAQIELWNGRGGEIWTRLQARLDELFTPLTKALLSAAAIKSGESILEIGCGCGDLTLLAATASGPGGRVQGIDISTRMLERAMAREQECRAESNCLAPIRWLEADAMLTHFEPLADLAISRFGVMFFADAVKAFINIKQALKPGGRLALLCWGPLVQNPWIEVPLDAVRGLIEAPLPPPEGAPGPFAFADPSRVLKILSEAGFSNATAQPIESALILGRAEIDAADPVCAAIDDALVLALESGPVAALLRNADNAVHLKVRDAIAAALRPHFEPEHRAIALAASCWLYQVIP